MGARKPRDTWREIGAGDRVLVAMSGGVDSSVAAALLADRGVEVVGVTMKNFCYADVPADASAAACCSIEAIDDARRVARQLGIVHHVLDFEGPFRKAVVDPFVAEYAAGRTPNPCVRCNRDVRFPQLWRKARAFGAAGVATGHYARAVRTSGGVELRRPADRVKDQTYYLWGLGPLLERAFFPLGELTKAQVRDRADALELGVADKPESQDVCFIPDGDLAGFLARESAAAGRPVSDDRFRPGPIVDRAGEIVGTHPGSGFFTVGQRRGLGVTADRPLYVTALGPDNELFVGPAEELDRDGLEAEEVRWLGGPPGRGPVDAEVQVRYRAAAVPARIRPRSRHRVEVRFRRPVRAIAPGQTVAFYAGDRLLGGGTIARALG